MALPRTRRPAARGTAAALFAVSALALTACGDDPGEPPFGDVVDVDDRESVPGEDYDGLYDAAFADGIAELDGEEVTLTAEVREVLSPMAFVIEGTENIDVEPLLVVGAADENDLEQGLTVEVHGIIHSAFDLAAVEEEVGTDLEDALFSSWDGRPYLAADDVDNLVAGD